MIGCSKTEHMKKLFLLLALPLLLAGCKPKEVPVIDDKDKEQPTVDPELNKANTTVVYECNERLFARQDAFNAIRSYLPVLEQMQVNVLWLMPIHPRGTVNAVGSPYCVKDYYAIDPAFGTMADLKALVDDCHDRGMKVMLDWIANHTAFDNQWHNDHPDWYTTPVGEETNWNDVAPLNYAKTEVQQAMQDAMVYWVSEADIDGFRCDYAEGVPNTFWTNAINAIREVKPEAIMLAEASNTSLYQAGFDWMYSWNYLGAVQNVFRNSRGLSNLFTTSNNEYNATPAGKERLRYVTTHDASSEEAPSTYYHTAKGELAAACVTFFIGGVPMIYSSQEIGDVAQLDFFNYHIKSFSADNATTKAYIALMKAYTASAEARYGELTNHSTDQVAMFSRKQSKAELLVIVNTTAAEQNITLPMQWQREECTDLLTGEKMYAPKSATLGAYEYRIYSR